MCENCLLLVAAVTKHIEGDLRKDVWFRQNLPRTAKMVGIEEAFRNDRYHVPRRSHHIESVGFARKVQ